MRSLTRKFLVLLVLSLLIPVARTIARSDEFEQDEMVLFANQDVILRLDPATTSPSGQTMNTGTEVRLVGAAPVLLVDDFLKSTGAVDLQPFGTPVASECWDSSDITELGDGSLRFSRSPNIVIEVFNDYSAEVRTSAGNFTLALDVAAMPVTVNNFVCLARYGFYEGTTIHRVVPGTLIQGGDPEGRGTGGPGYEFPSESFLTTYDQGVIAMASMRPNANGSQFFITVTSLQHRIDPEFPIFGHVIDGMEVIDAIASVEVEMNDRDEVSYPVDEIVVDSITIVENLPLAGPEVSPMPDFTATAEARAALVTILSGDIFFEPDEVTIAADTDVTFLLPNEGAALHNFVIDELDIEVDIDPGAEAEVVINAPAGEYEFYCDIPGHREAGMVGTLIVE